LIAAEYDLDEERRKKEADEARVAGVALKAK